jgi:acetoin utilization protein AcuB
MTRHVVRVSMDDSLRQVRDLFDRHKFHHVLVTEHGRVVGIISDRDLLANISPFVDTPTERRTDAASLNRKAHQIMTRRLVAGTPRMQIGVGAALLLKHNISCLPVLDAHGECVGIVTWKDLLRWGFRDVVKTHRDKEPTRKAA